MTTGRARPGDLLAGDLRVLRTLGEGGYGTVYEAERLGGGPRLAVKVLHERLGASEVAHRRFERELALVQRLRHPGIVAVSGWGWTDAQLPYIAFEMLEGRTLREELDGRGALGPWHAAAVTRQALEALAHAHAAGVVHRDIKPANIFLVGVTSEAPRVKILDFGVARSAEGSTPTLTANGQMIGTPHYMSPEQVRGLTADHRADLYSLGVVLSEMLSGDKLLQADTEIELLMIHADEGPLPLPPVVRATPLSRVVERAVLKRPEARFPDAPTMLAELDGAVAELGRSGAGPGPAWTVGTFRTALVHPERSSRVAPPPAAPAPRRRIWPWLAAAAGALTVVTLIVAGIYGATRRRGEAPPAPSSPLAQPATSAGAEQRHRALLDTIRRRISASGYRIADEEHRLGMVSTSTFVLRKGEISHAWVFIFTYPQRSMAETLAEELAGDDPRLAVRRLGTSVVQLNRPRGDAEPLMRRLLVGR